MAISWTTVPRKTIELKSEVSTTLKDGKEIAVYGVTKDQYGIIYLNLEKNKDGGWNYISQHRTIEACKKFIEENQAVIESRK